MTINMSDQQGLQTPRRTNFNIFDDDVESDSVDNKSNTCLTFTPCTRLSRMTIDSQSNGSRMRAVQYQLPAMNLNDKLMQVIREEKEEQAAKASTSSSSTCHPNLDMYLNADKISIIDNRSSRDFSFSEDEESDEGDLFSSSLYPLSSPERPFNRKSIFDEDYYEKDGNDNEGDEPMHHESPLPTVRKLRTSIFDEDEKQEDTYDNHSEVGSFYDPTTAWLSCIYHDNDNKPINNLQDKDNKNEQDNDVDVDDDDDDDDDDDIDVDIDIDDDENRAPRQWNNRKHYEKKIRRTSPQEEENAVQDRIPLQEINVEDYYSDNEDLPVKKKVTLSSRKPHKLRFMRALSPPKYMSKAKKKETLNSSSLSISPSTTSSL